MYCYHKSNSDSMFRTQSTVEDHNSSLGGTVGGGGGGGVE